jgi:hypothetical protein
VQFHEYTTFRTIVARQGDDRQKDSARKRSSHEFRKDLLRWFVTEADRENSNEFNHGSLALGEEVWVGLDRPYYDVWPIAVSLAASVRLDLPFSAVQPPFDAMLLRLARGHEPHRLRTAMLFWPKGFKAIQVFCHFADEADSLSTVQHAYEPQDAVEEWLLDLEQHSSPPADYQRAASLLIVRLVVFIGLLSHDEDFITPIVLAKDRAKYESTGDAEAKRWIEERAARRAGRGFDVGKKLQLAKDTSPHWRNPHLCLFWIGEGRTRPVIQMRSGAIVQSVSMAQVPTGFLGPERNEEDHLAPEKTPREAISARRRFEILKRDGFRCQLCGASSENGSQLHVDHRIPIAKGGSNEDDNLWTLCERCNLGKSDGKL